MRRSQVASVPAAVMLGAVFVSLLAGCTSTAARPPASRLVSQQAILKGSDVIGSVMFGTSTAISGATAVVGTAGASDAGRAYVFRKTASGWTQVAELKGSDAKAEDGFASSVAISGTTIVVGAPGHADNAGRAYVFAQTSSGWKQVAELEGSDTLADESFGWSVAISGTTIVVGAVGYHAYAGKAYVFSETGSAWTQTAELVPSPSKAKDGFGTSVAVSGSTAIVGAEGVDKAGATFVFAKSLLGWTQVAQLKGSDTADGDSFGASVGISGSRAVVGAYGHAASSGRAYVFTGTDGVWTQAAELKGSDTSAGDYFGVSVAISGTTVVVGAYESAKQAGRAYLFKQKVSGWKQTAELTGSNIAKADFLGSSAAISGTTVVVGAYGYGGRAGRAYVYNA
ncbi:MAG: hypothetical protein ABSG36_07275 [Acidimicrobiales bacterium]